MLYLYIMFCIDEFPKPLEEQLKDINIQIEALTHYPELVYVYESEDVLSGMVTVLKTKQAALLEHQRLIDEFDLSGQAAQDTLVGVNI